MDADTPIVGWLAVPSAPPAHGDFKGRSSLPSGVNNLTGNFNRAKILDPTDDVHSEPGEQQSIPWRWKRRHDICGQRLYAELDPVTHSQCPTGPHRPIRNYGSGQPRVPREPPG